MKVLSATKETGKGQEPVSDEQYRKDYREIKRIHKEGCKKDMTWPVFGGVIRIGDRRYQVAP